MAIQMVAKEDLVSHIGTKFDPSDWITLDQERINNFADCTEDHQFIHIDKEKAALHGVSTRQIIQTLRIALENATLGSASVTSAC